MNRTMRLNEPNHALEFFLTKSGLFRGKEVLPDSKPEKIKSFGDVVALIMVNHPLLCLIFVYIIQSFSMF